MHNDSNGINARACLGAYGEERVAEYLKNKGWHILSLNYKQPFGEIDCIAQRDTMIIFVEVKTRRKKAHCSSELISNSKQKKIIKTAKSFISKHCTNQSALTYRFDIALLTNDDNTIHYIENAFYGNEW